MLCWRVLPLILGSGLLGVALQILLRSLDRLLGRLLGETGAG